MSQTYHRTLRTQAKTAFAPIGQNGLGREERLTIYKDFLKIEATRIREVHDAGAGGIYVATLRAQLLDIVLQHLLEAALLKRPKAGKLALVANGGYGRGLLNPSSDIDLLFLLPRASNKLPKDLGDIVEEILYVLWDVGFKVGHSSRSVVECIKEGRADPVTRTSLFDSRLLAGDEDLHDQFRQRFRRECIQKDSVTFFKERSRDIRSRYRKFSSTVFLQEPNIKESPGGMRDFHNLLWIADALFDTRRLKDLTKRKILTKQARLALEKGFDFLHRVRNQLHYHTGKQSDLLTLRFQGEIVDALGYKEPTKLRRIEAFMRDYYTHTRNIHQSTNSVFEIAEIETTDAARNRGLQRWLSRGPKTEEFDGFISREGRLFPAKHNLFEEDPTRMLRLFLHCQEKGLTPAPELRKLIKLHWDFIDQTFRYLTANRECFQRILEHKGEAAQALRWMHRTGVLGRYIPEFGALDCLVQHEFFHRYTADEHTLRCIDQLDALMDSEDPAKARYRKLLINIEDPYALYLALILHDTGRAENVREHIDGSAMLANQLCRRLQITGGRRKLIMFLVDHHLSMWLFATKKDIADPDVIAEFGGLMKEPHLLDALLLFTYADSNGTNEEAWSPWKETLILQLHRATRAFLKQGYEAYDKEFRAGLAELRSEVEKILDKKYHPLTAEHFELMPKRYFRYRSARSVNTHIRAIWQYVERRRTNPDTPFEAAFQWIAYPDHGYTELTIVTHDRPLLLEKICCALASRELNILCADIYTRPDGIVIDIIRISTLKRAAVKSTKQQLAVIDTLYDLNQQQEYDPAKYLTPKTNYLRPKNEQSLPFPVRAHIDNESDPNYTVVEIQAIDRIGLLHDLLHAINRHGLCTTHARITTEKGAALDTLFVHNPDKHRITELDRLTALHTDLNAIIGAD
jgi:[protein-PII] uridylyltransferase